MREDGVCYIGLPVFTHLLAYVSLSAIIFAHQALHESRNRS